MTGPFYGFCQKPLVIAGHARDSSWHDLSPFSDELGQGIEIFIIDRFEPGLSKRALLAPSPKRSFSCRSSIIRHEQLRRLFMCKGFEFDLFRHFFCGECHETNQILVNMVVFSQLAHRRSRRGEIEYVIVPFSAAIDLVSQLAAALVENFYALPAADDAARDLEGLGQGQRLERWIYIPSYRRFCVFVISYISFSNFKSFGAHASPWRAADSFRPCADKPCHPPPGRR